MTNMTFIKGMGIGIATGVALGMAMAPKKRSSKNIAGKAIKAFGEVVDTITNTIVT